MNEVEIFDKPKECLNYFEGELNAKEPNTFIEQFKLISSCETAIREKSICYAWFTEKSIPRLKGCSNVVYIGKTNNTFKERHYQYAKLEGSDLNWVKYQHIINDYGRIRIVCCSVVNPREYERDMLIRYVMKHLELPPINTSL